MKTMGIDLGTRKVAYALWDEDVLTDTDAYESGSTTRQLQLMDCADFIYEAVYHTNPDIVLIEDTLMGNNRKYSIQLSQMMGAVLYTLSLRQQDALGDSEHVHAGFDLYPVNVSTWKKEVLGNGRASKEDVRRYLYSRDSAYHLLCGDDQDRFDAACIGYYGLLIHRRSEALLEAHRSARSRTDT